MNLAKTASTGLVGGIVSFGAAVEGSSPKIANMALNLGTMVEALGPAGLVGVAGAAGIVLGVLGAQQQHDALLTQDHAQSVNTLSAALKESNGVITENVRRTVAADIQSKSYYGDMKAAGITLKDLTDVALGVPGAFEKVTAEIGRFGAATPAMADHGRAAGTALLDQGVKANNLTKDLGSLAGTEGDAAQKNRELAGAAGATTAVLVAQGTALSGSQQFFGNYGSGILKAASDYNTATSGIKGLADAQVSANTGFFAAQSNWTQLDQAVTQASKSYQQAANAIGTAEHGITQASQGVASAQHAEAQSAKAVITAQAGVVQAEQGVTQAEGAYRVALGQEKVAQDSLMAARAAAAQQLKDLDRQVTDSADTEHSAQLRLLDAQNAVKSSGLSGKTLADLGPLSSANETQFKLLADLESAQHNYNDTMAASAALATQNAAAQAAGINGNQSVISATQGVDSAQQSAASSAKALADSKTAVTTASAAVKDAQYQEEQAHLATQNAVFGERQAQAQLSMAKDAESAALAALSVAKASDSRSTDTNTAAGARNFTQIEGLFEANLSATGSVTDATTATQAQTTAMGFSADAVQGVINRVTGLSGMTAQFGIVGLPSVDLSSLINAANAQSLDPRQLGFTSAQIGNARRETPTGSSYADGGLFRGAGSTTSDSNVIAVSDREYIVNARSTAKHLPLIEAINSDRLPGYASGGLAGTGKAVIKSNLDLAELGAMGQAISNTMAVLGVKSGLKWPTSQINPPIIASGGGSLGAFSGSAARAQAYAQSQLGVFGWGPDQMPPLVRLWNRESGWNSFAVNPSSGAAGIAQSLGHGPVRLGDDVGQINWGLNYIKGRYGSPAAAWGHEVADNWYRDGGMIGALRAPKVRDNGGPIDPGWNMIYNGTGRAETSRSGTQEDALLAELRSLRRDIKSMAPVTVNAGPGMSESQLADDVVRRLNFHRGR
jgi:hypothetical protein